MQPSKYQNLSLDELRRNLTLAKEKICYQQQEIERTQGYIVTFEDCIKKQKEALTNYVMERVKLKEERSKLKSIESTGDNSTIASVDSALVTDFENLSERNKCPIKRKVTSENDVILQTKRKSDLSPIIKVEHFENIKSESGFEGSISEKGTSECIKGESQLNPRKKWNRLKYLNNKVYQMHVYRQSIFICGSQGMLVMITNNETISLNTDTKDDIRQMVLFKYNNTDAVSLAAFTANHMYAFVDVLKHQIVETTVIQVTGNVFQNKSFIYLPVFGNEIKKINKSTLEIKSHIHHEHNTVRFFVPCAKLDKKKALVSLEDQKLYKTMENDFDILEVIVGVSTVKNLLRLGEEKYVCSSSKKVWILDSKPSITETLRFSNEVKFTACSGNNVVVVDTDNRLVVYQDQQDTGVKILHEQAFTDDITAITFQKNKIFLLILDEIVVLKIIK